MCQEISGLAGQIYTWLMTLQPTLFTLSLDHIIQLPLASGEYWMIMTTIFIVEWKGRPQIEWWRIASCSRSFSDNVVQNWWCLRHL
eukprot:scaffold100545_cov32-Prasinocladus_malaysianus.AAC.1